VNVAGPVVGRLRVATAFMVESIGYPVGNVTGIDPVPTSNFSVSIPDTVISPAPSGGNVGVHPSDH